MAEWRDKKYVLDSDAEDEEISQDVVGASRGSEDGPAFMDITELEEREEDTSQDALSTNIEVAADHGQDDEAEAAAQSDTIHTSLGTLYEFEDPLQNIESQNDHQSAKPLKTYSRKIAPHTGIREVETTKLEADGTPVFQDGQHVSTVEHKLALDDLYEDELALQDLRADEPLLKDLLDRTVQIRHEDELALPDLPESAVQVRCEDDLELPDLQLFAELRQHLGSSSARVDRGPTTPLQTARLGAESTDDSPLSSLSSLLDEPTPQGLHRGVILPSTLVRSAPTEQAEARLFPRERVLRERKAIQLHPYVIEGERYRQTLQSRGLKPVRIAVGGSQLTENDDSQNEASEDASFQYAEQSFSALSNQASVEVSSQQQSQGQNDPTDFTVVEDEDFPDLAALLRARSHGTVNVGFKRRKVGAFNGPGGKVQARTADDVDAPLSPPWSGPLTSPYRPTTLNGFKFPISLGDKQLNTPAHSSEPRPKPMPRWQGPSPGIRSRSSSQDSVQILAESDDATSPDISSEEEEAPRQQIDTVQKKIRGVLPASWLRLDLKKQAAPTNPYIPTQQGRASSPQKQQWHRGIARPLNHPRIRGLPDEELSPMFDDSESEPEIVSKSTTQLLPFPNTTELDEEYPRLDNDIGIAMEDDTVDPMLPKTSGRSRQHQSGARRVKKRQRRLSETMEIQRGIQRVARPLNNGTHNHKVGEHHTVKPYRKRTATQQQTYRQMSIIDSVDIEEPTTVPLFLRVAARTARARDDRGRHGPSHKVLRLATNDDNIDIQTTISDWRTHRKPRASNSVIAAGRPGSRSALATVSGNRGNYSVHSARKRTIQPGKVHTAVSRTRTTLGLTGSERQTRLPGPLSPVRRAGSIVVTPQQPPASNIGGRRGFIASNLYSSDNSGPALLETTKRSRTTDHYRGVSRRISPLLENFLDLEATRGSIQHGNGDYTRIITLSKPCNDAQPRRKRLVKRVPKRLDIVSLNLNPPSLPQIVEDVSNTEHFEETLATHNLIGLGGYGTQYSTSFDITPLPATLSFSKSSLVGSGSFASALCVGQNRSFDDKPAYHHEASANIPTSWSDWNEVVSTQLARFVDSICARLGSDRASATLTQQQTTSFNGDLEAFIQYINNHLYFLDPVDRKSFLQSCLDMVRKLTDRMDEFELRPGTTYYHDLHLRTAYLNVETRLLVITHQLLRIAQHTSVSASILEDITLLARTSVQRTTRLALSDGLEAIRTFYKISNTAPVARLTPAEAHGILEALIVLHHIHKADTPLLGDFWKSLETNGFSRTQDFDGDVAEIERTMQDLFTILPILEIDSHGAIKPSASTTNSNDSWQLVKRLIRPVLQAYDDRSSHPTLNIYLRATFTRCFHLIQAWGWRRCEIIVGVLFDFFGRNKLYHLRHETGHGSPTFLERLKDDIKLSVDKGDRCYHILLKVIAVGLREMAKIYPEKKMISLVSRLIPNHSRTFPKDQSVRQEDLDSLRNHHDLLCVLYWASPEAARPRLSLLKDLVQVDVSHGEACHINIRAWSNLINYQLSTAGNSGQLQIFKQWFEDVMFQVLAQHKLARSEVEAQAAIVNGVGQLVSKELQESTIARNQRKVEAVLGHALQTLLQAVTRAQSPELGLLLLPSVLCKVFEMYSETNSRVSAILIQALQIVDKVCENCHQPMAEEDSQGFGDWTGFEEIGVDRTIVVLVLPQVIQDSLWALLSTCFAAEHSPDDALLCEVVKCWTSAWYLNVSSGSNSWNELISPYGSVSWSSLASTQQTSKYTAFFLTRLVTLDEKVYMANRSYILSAWIKSLVERESQLKYQHDLTSAIINADPEEPLFNNLPFVKSSVETCTITYDELRDRRLALISSLLSNVRESLLTSAYFNLSERPQQKQEYVHLLKGLMAAMRANYLALGDEGSASGAYVNFVQRVIELLQQYTVEICPIDRFFTMSTTFPLPAHDPQYVVGRLRNYATRMEDPKTAKQLAIFVQELSERAVVDQEQEYLISQLSAAMLGNPDSERASTRILRAYLVEQVFPAYIQMAFTSSCGWILVLPVLKALQATFADILLDDDSDPTSFQIAKDAIMPILGTLSEAIRLSIGQPDLLDQPAAARTLACSFSAIASSLPTLDYYVRTAPPAEEVKTSVQAMYLYAQLLLAILQRQPASALDLSNPAPPPPPPNAFALRELRDSLTRNWSYHDQRYHLVRGNVRREVKTDLGRAGDEQAGLVRQLQTLMREIDRRPALSGRATVEIKEEAFACAVELADGVETAEEGVGVDELVKTEVQIELELQEEL